MQVSFALIHWSDLEICPLFGYIWLYENQQAYILSTYIMLEVS